MLLDLKIRGAKLIVRVNSGFFMSGSQQVFSMSNKTVMWGDRVVGEIQDITRDYTEIDITDPVAIGLIKGGVDFSSVSMGCKVNDINNDNMANKSKVKSDSCGYIARLKKLNVM